MGLFAQTWHCIGINLLPLKRQIVSIGEPGVNTVTQRNADLTDERGDAPLIPRASAAIRMWQPALRYLADPFDILDAADRFQSLNDLLKVFHVGYVYRDLNRALSGCQIGRRTRITDIGFKV
jgi:hypothetical protein